MVWFGCWAGALGLCVGPCLPAGGWRGRGVGGRGRHAHGGGGRRACAAGWACGSCACVPAAARSVSGRMCAHAHGVRRRHPCGQRLALRKPHPAQAKAGLGRQALRRAAVARVAQPAQHQHGERGATLVRSPLGRGARGSRRLVQLHIARRRHASCGAAVIVSSLARHLRLCGATAVKTVNRADGYNCDPRSTGLGYRSAAQPVEAAASHVTGWAAQHQAPRQEDVVGRTAGRAMGPVRSYRRIDGAVDDPGDHPGAFISCRRAGASPPAAARTGARAAICTRTRASCTKQPCASLTGSHAWPRAVLPVSLRVNDARSEW